MRGNEDHIIQRGEIWLVQFDPVVGHEQAGRRPALVVSSDSYHRLQAGLVSFVPITGRRREWPSYVPVTGSATGLDRASFAMADQIRTMSIDRVFRRLGYVDSPTLEAVRMYLKDHLEL